ncbi:MAG: putative membrane protein YphA (DoxX/SURF4 family) [Akkermansiaceae bacterium]|jgi:uncharacterized membrane protein YphA (DoxX/SURF4 family)
MRPTQFLEWNFRIALAAFFIGSGSLKVEDLSAFTESVGNFQFYWEVSWNGESKNFFDAPTDAMIAYVVPWFEIFAGVTLLIPFSKVAGAVILMVMLVCFNLALGYAWSLGITDLLCGCHGKSDTPTNFPLKIASNIGLMYLAGIILWLSWYHRRLASEMELSHGAP